MGPKRPSAAARSAAARRIAGRDFDGSLLRAVIVWLVALKIAGLLLVFDPRGLVAFDLPKSLYSRAHVWVIGAALVFALLQHGRAIVPRTRLHLVVGAFAAANLAATIFAENQYIALVGERSRYVGLTFVGDMLLLYFAVAIAFRRVADWAVFAAVVLISALASAAYAAVQYVGLDPIRWTDDPRIRPFASFGNADMYGHFLSILLGGAVGVALYARGRALRGLGAATVALAVSMAAVVGTRGVALGILGTVFALPIVHVRAVGFGLRTFARLASAGAVVLVVGIILLAASPLGARLQATFEGVGVQDRLLLYDSAAAALLDRPLIGYGPDSFAVAYPRYRQAGSAVTFGPGTTQSSAHNWVLQVAATTGGLGLLTLLALIGAAGWLLWSQVRTDWRPVAAPLLLMFAGYWSHALVAVNAVAVDWLPWVAYGGAAAGTAWQEPAPRLGRAIPGSWQVSALVAAVVAATITSLSAFDANRAAWAASQAWKSQQGGAVVALAELAVRRDSGRADYWNWLGLGHDLQKQWRQASDAFAEAASRVPYRSTYWANLAKTRVREALEAPTSGKGSSALAAARQAIAADPNDPTPHIVFAEVATALGEFGAATRAAVRAMELYPGPSNYDRVAATAATNWSDAGAARVLLESAIFARDTAPLRVALAQLSLRLGDRDAARSHARRALEMEPGNAEAQAALRDAGG